MSEKPYIEIDREELRRLYEVEGLTTRQISEVMNVGHRTVARRLGEFGIDARPQGSKHHKELRDADWLRHRYIIKKLSTISIAEEIGASPKVVSTWIHRHGIPIRTLSESTKGRRMSDEQRALLSKVKKGRYRGALNPNWRGGKVTKYQRERTSYKAKKWSLDVRSRDGNACVDCGASDVLLHAHHIKSFKEFPELRYDLSNGVTVCPSCHQARHDFDFPDWVVQDERRTSAGHRKVKI